MRALISSAIFTVAVVCGLSIPSAQASIWTGGGGDSSWSSPLNWTGGVPNAIDAVADFSTLDIPGDTMVNLNGNRTVGTLLFADLGPPLPPGPAHNWILNPGVAPASLLTLDVSSGSPIIHVANPTALPINSFAVPDPPNPLSVYDTFVDQTATINTVLAGNDGMTKSGPGTLVLTAANLYVGTTNHRFGNMILDFSGAGGPASNILSVNSSLSLGGGTTHATGGFLTVRGAAGESNSQSFTGTTIDFGHNRVSVEQNGATTVNVSLGTISRTLAGGLNLTLPTSGNISAASASIPNVNGIIGGWATVGTGETASWAMNDGSGNIIAKTTGFTEVTEAPTIASDPTSNVRWSGSTGNATVNEGITDINSLIFPDMAVRTLTIPAGSTLRIGASGGIFKSHPTNQGVSLLNVGTAGSFLTAGGAPNTAGELVLNANSAPLSNDQDGIIVNSTITDNGGGVVRVVKTGTSTARLSAANSYSGGTYILEGRARANVLGAYGTGDVYVASGAQAYFQVAGIFPNNMFLSGKGFWETGGFPSGAMRLSANGVNLTGTITLLSDAQINYRGANAAGAIISGKVTGDFDAEFTGAATGANTIGALTLTNSSNDWTGDTIISNGRLTVGGSGEVIPHGAGNGNVIMRGDGVPAGVNSLLNLNGNTETINALSATGDLTKVFVENSLVNSVGTLMVGANNQSSSFGGTMRDNAGTGGTVALTKIGTGTLTLAGANSYTGPTAIQNGTLKLGVDGSLPPDARLTLGSSTNSGVLDLGGFNASVSSLTTSGTGTANLIGNSSTVTSSLLTVTSGTNTFAATIQNSVSGGTQTVGLMLNAGSLTLSGTNTYTGPTTIQSGGTLTVTGSLASTANVEVNTGATLSGAGNGTTTGRVGNVTLENGSSLRPGTTADDDSVGTLTMSSLTVNGGDLRMDLQSPGSQDHIAVAGAANFAGASTISPTGLISGGAAMQTAILVDAGTLSGTPPTLIVPPVTRPTFALAFDTTLDEIRLTISGTTKVLTWTGANGSTWDLNTTTNWVDGGMIPEKFFNLDQVIFGNGPTNRNVVLNTTVAPDLVSVNNSAGNDYTISGAGAIGDTGFAGGTRLLKTGTGKLTLSTANTYLGTTNIQNGTLQIGSAAALPATTAVVLGSAATSGVLDLAGFTPTVGSLSSSGTGTANIVGNSSNTASSILILSGEGGVFSGTIQDTLTGGTQTVGVTVVDGTHTLAGANTYTGPTTINAGATLQIGGGGTSGSLSAATAIADDGTLIFNRSDTFTISNFIVGLGSVQKQGTGTLVLTSDSNYLSGTVVGAGTFQLGNGGTTGSNNGAPVSIAGGAVLAFNRSDDFSFADPISGAGAVRKLGPASLTLSGTSTYTGPTTVTSGTLIVTNNASLGALPGGPVTIESGAALDLVGNPTANNANFGAKEFRIAGSGVLGSGALTNSGANQQNAFQRVVLTANATVGGSGRFDIRGAASTLDLAGFTLTKAGPNQFTLAGTTATAGNIVVNEGILALQTTTTLPNTAITVTAPAMFNVEGTASVGDVNGAGSTTVGTGTAAAALTANHVRQGSFTVRDLARTTIRPNGGNAGTSVAGTFALETGGTMDLTNNDFVVQTDAATKNDVHNELEARIVSAQNGFDANFITRWSGPGLASSAARTANVAAGFDLTALGVIRNSDLDITTGVPGSTYATFSGQAVTPDNVLVKYTYTGDGNLDGAVTFDDYAAMDAAFFGLIPNLGWATGDINFDGVINFDDYAVVDQAFFNQGAPLAGEGGGVAAVPEPGAWILAAVSLLFAGFMLTARRGQA